MSNQQYDHIRSNDKFHSLVAQRSKLSWILAAMILLVYYSFILIIAFFPELFGIPLNEATTITWGIVVGIAVILFTFLITGIYVYRANTHYDGLLQDIVDASSNHVNNLNTNNNNQGEV